MLVVNTAPISGNIVSEFVLDDPLHKWGTSGAAGTAGGTVTYSFATSVISGTRGGVAYSSDAFITDPNFQQAIRQAFDTWAVVANISFSEVTDASDVQIRFAMDAIDGASNTLGFADTSFTSIDGGATWTNTRSHIIYDTAESWTTTSFLSTSIHEIGHSLGIDHSDVPGSIMQAVTIGDNYGTALTQDDINAVQTLYGANSDPLAAVENIFRFFNPTTGSHYFATGDTQRSTIAATNPSWLNEGAAFQAATTQETGTIPVVRMFNESSGRYLFTADTTEISIIQNQGWSQQQSGVWFVTRGEEAALGYTTGVFRLYVPALQGHVYSSNQAEIDILLTTLNATNEGAAYFLNPSLTASAAMSFEYGLDDTMDAETVAALVGLQAPESNVEFG
ncbi:matrixin family metalloprotease [Labrenzia sp. PHM005]|uniref:matrixin family metalloprotease n=1 Tax=Labrenzia sp. PHM005 TaxID=2590016 RepID=UPI0011405248|nr:matrixin family metalloprotease [Labrenzia sp. PHM005]QDG74952.1 matrixin family metalloprotease [Labrenzia sp. PHM005]